jgi:hypothetical protein
MVTGVVNVRKKMALVGGSQLSAGERKKWVPVREMKIWAAGSFLCWAEGFPGVLFLFSFLFFFFFFRFLISFVSFVKMFQIN